MVRRLTLLVALALLPLAAADHVYSHRLVVTGRVVDAEGLPVAGQAVRVAVAGVDATHPCFDAAEAVTGPRGDFTLCLHAHEMTDGVMVNVTVAGASAEAAVDPALRRAAVRLQLPEPAAARDIEGERLFAKTFRVEGRVMRALAGVASVERVNVTSTPAGGEVVRVVLARDGTELAAGNATTNEHGDYALDLDAGDVERARVRIEVAEGRLEAPASARFRRADLDLVFPAPEAEPVVERPGTRTPEVPLAGGVAVAALTLAAIAARPRRGRRGPRSPRRSS
ncbi:MAG TPA: hypothetical protein VNX21_05275 [Candidatus Thermoplasmatota archaeon]|nr:hypothetical protein [Candidatus Thermoplasmatota archaeon]